MALASRERFSELFSYDEESGRLANRTTRNNRSKAGDGAGCFNRDGYMQVSVDGRVYLHHRLIWLLVTGYWPTDDIDHINGQRSDNRWANLREATRKQNIQNTAKRPNKTGHPGVHYSKAYPGHGIPARYVAQIRIAGRKVHLGRFETAEAAGAAYEIAESSYKGEFKRR